MMMIKTGRLNSQEQQKDDDDDDDDSDDNGDDCEDLEYWLELRPSDGGGAGQNPSGQAMSC